MPRTTRLLLPALALTFAAGASQLALAADTPPNDPSMWGVIALLPLPFLVIGLAQMLRTRGRPDAPVLAAGTLLGVGLGGFFDGILLHQILQWHGMLSSWIPPVDTTTMQINMLWDGLFHAFTWVVTVAGVVQLFRAGLRRGVLWEPNTLAGGMLGGWGMFNVIEGLVDHQFLGIHHVRPGSGELAWDVGYLLFGVLLIMISRSLTDEGRKL